ncbi:hypothetical protein ACFLRM_04990, partial [Acidobacteriota bacterium]
MKRKTIFWLILLRLIVVTTLLISVVIIQYSASDFLPLNSFYYLILLSYLLSCVYFILYYFSGNYTLQAYIQILFDLLIITALVYISGGVKGSFYFLYIFGIIAASVVISKRAANLIAALSAILFGLLVDGMYYGILPSFGTEGILNLSPGMGVGNLFIAWGAFFLVAILINFLTENLRRTRKDLSQAHKELEIKKSLEIAGKFSSQIAH